MASSFNLTVRLANAEMQTPADLANALSVLADELLHNTAGSAHEPIEMTGYTRITGNIKDANGNSVGRWNIEAEGQ